jgi:hypothetical protein
LKKKCPIAAHEWTPAALRTQAAESAAPALTPPPHQRLGIAVN